MKRALRVAWWVFLGLLVVIVGSITYSSIRPERLACLRVVNICASDFDYGWLQESQWRASGVLDTQAPQGSYLNQVVSGALLQHMLYNHGWELCGSSADASLAALWEPQLAYFCEEFPQFAHDELDLYSINTGWQHVLWCKAVLHRPTGHVVIDLCGKW